MSIKLAQAQYARIVLVINLDQRQTFMISYTYTIGLVAEKCTYLTAGIKPVILISQTLN